jgi:hypothetical protein
MLERSEADGEGITDRGIENVDKDVRMGDGWAAEMICRCFRVIFGSDTSAFQSIDSLTIGMCNIER